MTHLICLGANSDIYRSILPFVEAAGWARYDVTRYGPSLQKAPQWDVCLICIGSVAPVGMWWESDPDQWDECMSSNLQTPLRYLRQIWKKHKPGASVIWMAGSNPNMIMNGYSAYNVSKMAVLKLVEQLDYETPDAKFVALGPGTILTKIHEATRRAKWPNPKLAAVDAKAERTTEATAPQVWKALRWCVEQPKHVVGGRNICVSDAPGDDLASDPDLFKLRRKERRL